MIIDTEIGRIKDPIERFFAYMKERYQIYLKKSAGDPPPWTSDPILQKYKFCNIFREDDRTTRWFRENVRDRLDGTPEVLLATIVFRMFNRISTGAIIFHSSIWDHFVKTGNAQDLADYIRSMNPKGPHTTGAYIITSPKGYDKLDGICRILGNFHHNYPWREIVHGFIQARSLQWAWKYFKQVQFFGTFHSYEIVTDLRHTYLLENSTDIMTWSCAGPGAIRGLNHIYGRDIDFRLNQNEANLEMKYLLDISKKYWPDEYPPFEMRDMEHQNCEIWKYERTRLGLGRTRSVYK
jgi:5-hmdU DNA kinase-like protein